MLCTNRQVGWTAILLKQVDSSETLLSAGMPLAVKVVRVEDKALSSVQHVGQMCFYGKAKRDQLINEIHTLFRITKSHFLIELYDA